MATTYKNSSLHPVEEMLQRWADLYNLGKYQLARLEIRPQAENRRSPDPRLKFALGLTELALGRFKEAGRAFELARGLIKSGAMELPPSWRELGAVLDRVRQYSDLRELPAPDEAGTWLADANQVGVAPPPLQPGSGRLPMRMPQVKMVSPLTANDFKSLEQRAASFSFEVFNLSARTEEAPPQAARAGYPASNAPTAAFGTREQRREAARQEATARDERRSAQARVHQAQRSASSPANRVPPMPAAAPQPPAPPRPVAASRPAPEQVPFGAREVQFPEPRVASIPPPPQPAPPIAQRAAWPPPAAEPPAPVRPSESPFKGLPRPEPIANPNDPWAEWERALFEQIRRKQYAEALTRVRTALDKYPSSSRLREHEARLLMDVGETDMAVASWLETHRRASDAGADQRAELAVKEAVNLVWNNGPRLAALARELAGSGKPALTNAVLKIAAERLRNDGRLDALESIGLSMAEMAVRDTKAARDVEELAERLEATTGVSAADLARRLRDRLANR